MFDSLDSGIKRAGHATDAIVDFGQAVNTDSDAQARISLEQIGGHLSNPIGKQAIG